MDNSILQAALSSAIGRFTAANPNSASNYQIATNSLPGGDTRSTLHTDPFPISIARGDGTKLITADGAVLTDLLGELTAGIYGHSHAILRSAIISTFDNKGMSLGGRTEAEAQHAALICKRFGLDLVRFTNSGTEAVLYAILAARSFTKRPDIIIFNGAYHGSMTWAGADRTLSPHTVNSGNIVVLGYNDLDEAKRFFASSEAKNIAAILVEAMQGSGGGIVGDHEFLTGLQSIARENGSLFIVDEVMTSRLAPGGLQSIIPGLRSDLTILGKYLGGGFPFGAFGGREEVMKIFDPRRPKAVLHLGTFNNDTMTMNVGYTGLKDIFTPEACIRLNESGEKLRKQLNEITKGTKFGFTGIGSCLQLHATAQGVRETELKNSADVSELSDLISLFWFEMLEERFWLHKRGSVILSLGLPEQELDRFILAVDRFVKRHYSILKLK